MLITNIQETDPLKVYGNGLTFNDENATSDEIIRFINAVPQEISRLQFAETSLLPEHFGKVKNLDSLLIHNADKQRLNKEHLSIPISRLDLRQCSQDALSIDLFQNSFVDKLLLYGSYFSLPEGDYEMPNLTYFQLQSENLSSIPEGQHHFPKLSALYISKCELISIPDSFLNGKKLNILSVNSTELQQIPASLSNCEDLTHLNLVAPLSNGIPNLIDTAVLNVTLTDLEGSEYQTCQLPKTIKNVHIRGTANVNSLPDLSACEYLQRLDLNTCKEFPKLPVSLSHLNTLNCTKIPIQELPKQLNSATNLASIFLSFCPIIDFPTFLLDCAGLKILNFHEVKIKSLPNDWKACVNLETLVIQSDFLEVEKLDFAQKFKNLKTFDLSLGLNRRLGVGGFANLTRNNIPKMQTPILKDKYSLIGKKLLPLQTNSELLKGCQFIPVRYSGGGRNRSLKTQSFLDFCAALGKSKLSEDDKKYFFDLLWNSRTVQDLPKFDFSNFLKALNINFKPLAKLLQRRLVRNVLLQHFVKLKLVKSPKAFESLDPDKFLLQKDSKPMLDNVRTFLRNDSTQNVLLGLQMLKSGGVPADLAEELLLLAKTNNDAQVRHEAKELLKDIVPEEWQQLLKNQLVFYYDIEGIRQGFWEKQLASLADKIKPELAAFFALLVRSKYAGNSATVTEIDEFLFSVAENLEIEKKLLDKNSVVFVNGTTTLKKGEIREKLEAIGVKYAAKYSKKVTHVLIGKNPTEFQISRSDIQLLIENYLQKYLSSAAPDFLEEAEQKGDTSMTENVVQFLESEDPNSVLVGLEMLKTGGVPDSILPSLLVLQKSYDNARVRAAAKKLLERYGPAKWLPLLTSRLIFKSVGKGGKETDNFNRLIKLEKETSFEAAAELSLLFYQKYKRGLRFLIKRGAKGGEFHLRAYQAMFTDGFLDLSSGIGYTDWRKKGNLINYYGTTSAVNMSISFPKKMDELGEIKSIDLHNVKVKALPKGITNLISLEKIDASHNGIKSLPQGLKKLGKLEVLDLSLNHFDSFPERVIELSALKKLDLRKQTNGKLEIPESVRQALPNCEILV